MNYKYDLDMSASLSVQVVEQMIKDAVEKQTGKKIASMTVKYNESELAGYDIFFVPDNVKSMYVRTGKEFVVTEYDN
jgi:hypothetical protein